MFKLVDLCAGTGAFSLAFEETKAFKTVYANDYDKASKHIYDLNFSENQTFGDLNDIDCQTIPSHDILTSGFPCQSYSISGKRLGFKDPRSNIFFKLIEIMEFHKPRFVIFENVKNLVSHDKGNTFKVIQEHISNTGYKMKYKILNTCKYTTIPQNRERIYIVCFLNNEDYEKFKFPKELKEQEYVIPLIDSVPEKYYYTAEKSKIYPKLTEAVHNESYYYQYRRYYVRENKTGLCPTLTANMGTGGHNVPIIKDKYGIRKLTPRETFNLQGFPENYKLDNLSDAKLYKLAGNAVSVPVVRLIANEILNCINAIP